MSPGVPGKTHCGHSTSAVPAELYATKLVCTLAPGHRGKHFSRWSGYEWRGADMPTKVAAP